MTFTVTRTRPVDTHVFDDFVVFGKEMLLSEDIDPLYPVLVQLYALKHLNEGQRLWFTALYLAYYNLPSALLAFDRCPDWRRWVPDPSWALATGIERRGLRTASTVNAHLASYTSLLRRFGSHHWLMEPREDGTLDYEMFWEQAQTVAYNGRWAAFKWGELLKEVHAWPLSAPDMRLKYCSGPKEGLAWLYGLREPSLQKLELAAVDLMGRIDRTDLAPLSWERLETLLCNFNSLRKGRYYVGHDIDELHERIQSAMLLSSSQRHLIYRARAAALPAAYLGELTGGWFGVDRARMKAYQAHGSIEIRT